MKNFIKPAVSVIAIALFLFLLFVTLTRAQEPEAIAAGGQFSLEKQVVAGGSADKSSGQSLSESGTAGQAVAGTLSSGGTYTVYSGFWTPETLAPTAAGANICGRVFTAGGGGIRNAYLTLTSSVGEIRTARSSGFGFYCFNDVPAGESYVLAIVSKRFTFDPATQIISVNDNLTDVDFVALP